MRASAQRLLFRLAAEGLLLGQLLVRERLPASQPPTSFWNMGR